MNADLPTGSMHRRSQWRLAIAAVIGVVAGVLVPVPSGSQGWPFHVVVGYAVGAGLFSISALVHIMRMNPDQTRRHVNGLGGDRTEVDLVVFVGSFAALAAIGFMLFAGGKKTSSGTAIEAVASLVAVAAAWLSIHTAYALRYAKHYYNVEPGCIDFNTKEPPQFSDFAYLSFDLGMTYQVSDTSVSTKATRRIILFHTMLSYVFGTCIIASALNLVIGLASSG